MATRKRTANEQKLDDQVLVGLRFVLVLDLIDLVLSYVRLDDLMPLKLTSYAIKDHPDNNRWTRFLSINGGEGVTEQLVQTIDHFNLSRRGFCSESDIQLLSRDMPLNLCSEFNRKYFQLIDDVEKVCSHDSESMRLNSYGMLSLHDFSGFYHVCFFENEAKQKETDEDRGYLSLNGKTINMKGIWNRKSCFNILAPLNPEPNVFIFFDVTCSRGVYLYATVIVDEKVLSHFRCFSLNMKACDGANTEWYMIRDHNDPGSPMLVGRMHNQLAGYQLKIEKVERPGTNFPANWKIKQKKRFTANSLFVDLLKEPISLLSRNLWTTVCGDVLYVWPIYSPQVSILHLQTFDLSAQNFGQPLGQHTTVLPNSREYDNIIIRPSRWFPGILIQLLFYTFDNSSSKQMIETVSYLAK
jgi:hypothetical protein